MSVLIYRGVRLIGVPVKRDGGLYVIMGAFVIDRTYARIRIHKFYIANLLCRYCWATSALCTLGYLISSRFLAILKQ